MNIEKHTLSIIGLLFNSFLPAQDYQWAHSIGSGDAQYEWANDVEIDDAGNVYATGFFFYAVRLDPSSTDLTYSNGASDIYIQKFSPDGVLLWAHALGTSGADKGTALALDGQGQVFLGGTFDGTLDFADAGGVFTLTASGTMQGFVARFDANGIATAAVLVPTPTLTSNIGLTLRTTTEDEVLVGSMFRNTADFDPGPDVHALSTDLPFQSDFYLLKLNNDLQFQWVVGTEQSDAGAAWPYAIELDATGNIYCGGACVSGVDFDPTADTASYVYNGGESDSFISKYAPDGSFLWATSFGSNARDRVASIAVEPEGTTYVTGTFLGEGDFDGGSGETILQADVNGEGFLLKLRSDGQFVWGHNVGQFPLSTGTFTNSEALALSANTLLIGGRFNNTVDFDPGPGVDTVTTLNGAAFIIGSDTSGALIDRWILDGPGLALVYDIAVNDVNEMACSGYIFGQSVDMDPGPGVDTLHSVASGYDAFVMKFGPLTTSLPGSVSPVASSIFPNPGTDHFTITLPPGEHIIRLFDATGREVMLRRENGPRADLEASNLHAGLYTIRVDDDAPARWVKQ